MKLLKALAACAIALPSFVSAQAVDTLGVSDEGSGFEFRVGGYFLSGERNYSFNGAVAPTGSGQTRGVDVLLRGAGIGLYGKSITSTFTNQPNVVSADANVLLGVPGFSFMGGAGARALSSNLGTQAIYFYRGGAMMTFPIGGTGLKASIMGAGYFPQDDTKMKPGGEGEASLIYRPPGIPLFLQFGYRTEVFTTKSGSLTTPEEVRGLRLGGGILFGGY